MRLPQREEQPLLGSLRTLWAESTLKVQEMDFETLYQEFTSASNFEQKQTMPVADQLIADALESFKVYVLAGHLAGRAVIAHACATMCCDRRLIPGARFGPHSSRTSLCNRSLKGWICCPFPSVAQFQ